MWEYINVNRRERFIPSDLLKYDVKSQLLFIEIYCHMKWGKVHQISFTTQTSHLRSRIRLCVTLRDTERERERAEIDRVWAVLWFGLWHGVTSDSSNMNRNSLINFVHLAKAFFLAAQFEYQMSMPIEFTGEKYLGWSNCAVAKTT